MGDDETCNTSLALGIGLGEYTPKKKQKKDKHVIRLDLSLPLHLEGGAIDIGHKTERSTSMTTGEDEKQASKSSSSNVNKDDDNDINNNCVRKKLRLTKDQTTMLEESFKRHTTLNTVQKQALADKLNLKPRQVEVWFQNRRARTKLKQTEADCEFLRKCCESLSKENRRLKQELQELRSLKQPATIFRSTFSGCGTNNVCGMQEKREN